MTNQRKYTAYLFTILLGGVLNFAGGLTGEELAGIIKVSIAAFVLGNSAEHYLKKGNA